MMLDVAIKNNENNSDNKRFSWVKIKELLYEIWLFFKMYFIYKYINIIFFLKNYF
jgi:hypothetical protein